METRNVEWKIEPGPDGSLPAEQVTHALLIDIREAARSIRRMMAFFTVLVVVIDGVILFLWAISTRAIRWGVRGKENEGRFVWGSVGNSASLFKPETLSEIPPGRHREIRRPHQRRKVQAMRGFLQSDGQRAENDEVPAGE
jgi:hypothetical protein